MAARKKLPADYAVDALALEADRRRRKLGRPYSYGMLVADIVPEEREQIVEEYRRCHGYLGGRKATFLKTRAEAEREFAGKGRKRKNEEEE